MAIVPLTIAISLGLVLTFIVFFLREHARSRLSGAERDSLLPLAEETPRLVPVRGHDQVHDHTGDGCGCRNGTRRRAPVAFAPTPIPENSASGFILYSSHVRPKNHPRVQR